MPFISFRSLSPPLLRISFLPTSPVLSYGKNQASILDLVINSVSIAVIVAIHLCADVDDGLASQHASRELFTVPSQIQDLLPLAAEACNVNLRETRTALLLPFLVQRDAVQDTRLCGERIVGRGKIIW